MVDKLGRIVISQPNNGQNKKRPRTRLDPAKVRLLSIQQVLRIIDETRLRPRPSDEFVSGLHTNINHPLKWLKPRNKTSSTTDLKDLRELLQKVDRKLTPANMELLSGVSAAKNREFRPRDGSMVDSVAIKTIKRFAAINTEILQWLGDRRACDLVLSSLKPELDLQTVAGHLL